VDLPNAFLGNTVPPTSEALSAALADSAEAWRQLIDWLAEEQGVVDGDWNSSSPKHGWTFRLKLKKRTIVYLSPCNCCFRVAFALGDRAVAAARQSNLPKSVLKAIDVAPHYAEGTGIRLMVKGTKDLPAIRKLALVKLAN